MKPPSVSRPSSTCCATAGTSPMSRHSTSLSAAHGRLSPALHSLSLAMRPTPFELAFGAEAEERFPRIRESLAGGGARPARPRCLHAGSGGGAASCASWCRRRGRGGGAAARRAAAHAYLYWAPGGWIFRLTKTARGGCYCAEPGSASPQTTPMPPARLLPPAARAADLGGTRGRTNRTSRWTGCSSGPGQTAGYFVLAVFGLHPGHRGSASVDADGYPESELVAR